MKSEKFKGNYCLVSKYRTELMGLAIILIMFCHLDVTQRLNGIKVSVVAKLLQSFTVGVDMFMFLSGVGLFYAYSRRRQTYFSFEKKRLCRTIPKYLIIGGFTYLVYDICFKHLGIKKMLSDLLFISWFKEGITRYWYIFAINVFYLIFPLLYYFIQKNTHNRLLILFLFCTSWIIIIEFLCQNNTMLDHFRIALERLPIFVFGIYCGELSYKGKRISEIGVNILLLFGYAAFILFKLIIPDPFYMYLYYPVRGFLAVSLMITVIILMEYSKYKYPTINESLETILKWFGSFTLELYLLHQSYMILFESPYKPIMYLFVAFILPVITVWILQMIKWRLIVTKSGS